MRRARGQVLGWLLISTGLVVLIAWVWSIRWSVVYQGQESQLTLAGGQITAAYRDGGGFGIGRTGWHLGRWSGGFNWWIEFDLPGLDEVYGVGMALWPVPLVMVPAGVVLAVRAARRRRRGWCLRCGYDRRGLAAGAACPECGAREVSSPG